MTPGIIGAIISAGANLLGQSSANKANARLAREQMEHQDLSTAKQMEFQERMSNTQHQRAMADLRAAGLNPILAAQNGAGTPSGASSSGASAHMENVAGPAVNSALHAAKNAEELKVLKAQKEDLWASADLKSAQRGYTAQMHNTEYHHTDSAKFQKWILENSAKGAAIEGDIDSSWVGRAARHAQRFNPFGSSANQIRNLFRGSR